MSLSYANNLTGLAVSMSPQLSACVASNQSKSWSCPFTSPLASASITFSNYQGVAGNGSLNKDRKVCVPPNAGVVSGRSRANGATATETSTISFADLGVQDYPITIDVIAQNENCTAGLVEAQ